MRANAQMHRCTGTQAPYTPPKSLQCTFTLLLQTNDAVRMLRYTMPAGRVTADLLAKTMMPEYSLEEHLAKYVPKEKRGTEHISHNTSNASIVDQTEQ